jgi:hypothetical protein
MKSSSSTLVLIIILITFTQLIALTTSDATIDHSPQQPERPSTTTVLEHIVQLFQSTLQIALQLVWALLRFCTFLLFPVRDLGAIALQNGSLSSEPDTRLPLAEKLVSLSPNEASKFAAETLLSTDSPSSSSNSALWTNTASTADFTALPEHKSLKSHFCSCPPTYANLTHNFADSFDSSGRDVPPSEECIYLPDTEVIYTCALGYQADDVGVFVVDRLTCNRNTSGHYDWSQPYDQLLTDLDDQVLIDANLLPAERNIVRPAPLKLLTCSDRK